MTTGDQDDKNVLGRPLQPCSTRPMTGYYRDGSCTTGPDDVGSHSVCAVMTREFLEHQRQLGNDLLTPRLELAFAGLVPGDRWCVVAARWLQSLEAGCPAPVVLEATHERALEIIPLEALAAHAVDVPDDPGALLD